MGVKRDFGSVRLAGLKCTILGIIVTVSGLAFPAAGGVSVVGFSSKRFSRPLTSGVFSKAPWLHAFSSLDQTTLILAYEPWEQLALLLAQPLTAGGFFETLIP
jgi:hypothetical protein